MDVAPILDRLNLQYWVGREGMPGQSPIQLARMQLASSPSGCWPLALQTLKSNYDAATARDAWVALLSEPNSGWSTRDPQSGAWRLYCVPGYDALCGDSIGSCPIGPPQYVVAHPAGQTSPPSPGMTSGEKWTLVLVFAGMLWFAYMLRPETEAERRRVVVRHSHHNRRMVA